MEKKLIPKNKEGKKNWIQGAVNPEHKGYCTPMTKSTCTPKRKAFAQTMKKHHGFHKKEEGGILDFIPLSRNGNTLIAKNKRHGNLTDADRYPKGEGQGQKYPMVKESDFAGGSADRSYPIPTEGDAKDALYLAKIHKRPDVIAKIKERYPNLT